VRIRNRSSACGQSDTETVPSLPLIPHSEIDPEACGFLCEVMGENNEFVRKE